MIPTLFSSVLSIQRFYNIYMDAETQTQSTPLTESADGPVFSMKTFCKVQKPSLKDSLLPSPIQIIDRPHEGLSSVEIEFNQKKRDFLFEAVLKPQDQIESFFQHNFQHYVDEFIAGSNVACFAYGQTSSGKSSLIYKPKSSINQKPLPGFKKGLLELTVSYLNSTLKSWAPEQKQNKRIFLKGVQIYNEKIYDSLFAVHKPQNEEQSKMTDYFEHSKSLKMKESPQKEVYIQNLSEIQIEMFQKDQGNLQTQILEYLQRSVKNRQLVHTMMGSSSSRSQFLYELEFRELHPEKLGDQNPKGSLSKSRIAFVDLSGSQKVSKTGVEGTVLKQAVCIGMSLGALGNVISSLTNAKSKFVPYRDSRLTWYMKDYFKSSSRNIMFACIKPEAEAVDETLSTLRFVSRAANKNGLISKQMNSEQGDSKLAAEPSQI